MEEVIATLEEQRKSLIADLKEQNEEYDPAKIKAAREEIRKLENILSGSDKTSRFFNKHKEEFIQYHILPVLEAQEQGSVVSYQEQEYKQQQRIITRVKDALKSHKISIDLDTQANFSSKLQSSISGSVHILTTISNLKEHLFNLVLELVQILYLEEVLNELYPGKNIKVYKPPCVDDIKARIDCIVRVVSNKDKSVNYIPVDLKNSSNEEYLSAEQRP